MAVNERIQFNLNDLWYMQLAASQANRTDFTPGKATQDRGGMNWELDYRIPVGLPNFESGGPLEVERVRIELLHRNTICDQTISPPIASAPQTVTITQPSVWGGTNPTSTITPTQTQDLAGRTHTVIERTAGYDWAEGA